jgi:hypothetical protein
MQDGQGSDTQLAEAEQETQSMKRGSAKHVPRRRGDNNLRRRRNGLLVLLPGTSEEVGKPQQRSLALGPQSVQPEFRYRDG